MMETFKLSVVADLISSDEDLRESMVNVKRVTHEFQRSDVFFDLLINADIDGLNRNFIFEIKSTEAVVEQAVDSLRASIGKINLPNLQTYLLLLGPVSSSIIDSDLHGIRVISVADLNDEDWGNRLKTINIQMNMIIPSYNNLELSFDVDRVKKVLREKGLDQFSYSFSGDSERLKILDENGAAKSDLKSIFEYNERAIKPDEIGDEPVPQKYVFETPSFVESEIGLLPLKEIRYMRSQSKITSPIVIDASNDESKVIALRIIKELKKVASEQVISKLTSRST